MLTVRVEGAKNGLKQEKADDITNFDATNALDNNGGRHIPLRGANNTATQNVVDVNIENNEEDSKEDHKQEESLTHRQPNEDESHQRMVADNS